MKIHELEENPNARSQQIVKLSRMLTQPRSLGPKALVKCCSPVSSMVCACVQQINNVSNIDMSQRQNTQPSVLVLLWDGLVLMNASESWSRNEASETSLRNPIRKSNQIQVQLKNWMDVEQTMYAYLLHSYPMLPCCSSSFLWRSRVSVVHPNQKSERWIDRKTWKPAAPQSDAFRIKASATSLIYTYLFRRYTKAMQLQEIKLISSYFCQTSYDSTYSQWQVYMNHEYFEYFHLPTTNAFWSQDLCSSTLGWNFYLAIYVNLRTNQRSLVRSPRPSLLQRNPWTSFGRCEPKTFRAPGIAVEGMSCDAKVCRIWSLKI